ncbi:DUF6114 domain-containing protein [Streptomyces sp. SID3343]|uniref:DUF6114 domain-containing protein n=1 Tax=Streptomyces sp. SID3343 TaxID=2690260 RepID=UPI00136E4EA7|nr:hypothetical protein [Streptomyces sp. SID3343]
MTADQPQRSAFGRGRGAFRVWRHARPFWAGLFSILGAVPIMWAPYASLDAGDVTVQLQQFGGVSALFIGAILIMSGIALWLTPQARVYIGIFVILVSLVSFIVATLGGFFFGMLFGLIGGTLAVSWVYSDPPDSGSADGDGDDGMGDAGDDRDPEAESSDEGFLADALRRKDPDASGEARTGSVTHRSGDCASGHTAPRLALAAMAMATTGVLGVVGIAHASPSDPLPDNPYADGPCVSASPSGKPGSANPSSRPSSGAGSGAGSGTSATAAKSGSASAPASASPPASGSASASSSAPASASARPSSGTASPTASSAPATSMPASSAPATSTSAKPTPTSAKPSTSASSASSSKLRDGKTPYPCPSKVPVVAKNDSGLPFVAKDPVILKSSLLAMAGLNYQGVVKVKTKDGTEANALKFVVSGGMDIWNLSMTVKEDNGTDVVISSDAGSKSWMNAGVDTTMYVKSLKGNIFGVIPITFTPDSPPPINVPIVFFSNVESAIYAQLGGILHIPGYGINKGNVK